MCKLWHGIFPTKGTIKQYVERCRGQPFFATNNMADFHQVIVHDVCQVVGGQVIGTFVKHLVIENVAHNAHIATNNVVNVYFFARFHLEAYHILFAIINEALCFFLTQHQ